MAFATTSRETAARPLAAIPSPRIFASFGARFQKWTLGLGFQLSYGLPENVRVSKLHGRTAGTTTEKKRTGWEEVVVFGASVLADIALSLSPEVTA